MKIHYWYSSIRRTALCNQEITLSLSMFVNVCLLDLNDACCRPSCTENTFSECSCSTISSKSLSRLAGECLSPGVASSKVLSNVPVAFCNTPRHLDTLCTVTGVTFAPIPSRTPSQYCFNANLHCRYIYIYIYTCSYATCTVYIHYNVNMINVYSSIQLYTHMYTIIILKHTSLNVPDKSYTGYCDLPCVLMNRPQTNGCFHLIQK